MEHVMIDLETLGTRYDAPILSIGAVRFDPATGEQGAEFYEAISVEDALKHGVLSGATFKWWMTQSDPARRAVISGNRLLSGALYELGRFVKKDTDRVWGNGATFDITILEHAYHKAREEATNGADRMSLNIPWDFRGVRDCRTIAELACAKGYTLPLFSSGVAHNALSDAKHQAKWVSEAWQLLMGVPAEE